MTTPEFLRRIDGQQLWQAWQTWICRRELWLVATALVLAHAGQWWELIIEGNSREMVRVLKETSHPEPVLHLFPERKPDPAFKGDYRSIHIGHESQSLQAALTRGLVRPEKINSLTYYPTPTADELRRIAALPHLQMLTLYSTAGLKADDLSLLSKSTELKTLLVFDSYAYDITTDAIDWPSSLQVVALSGPRALSIQRVRELQTLPKLMTLEARLPPAEQKLATSHDIAAELQQFPGLRHLYLVTADDEDLERWQQLLPSIPIRPASYDRRRMVRTGFAAVLLCSQFAIILSQMSVQFAGSLAALLPGFRKAHFDVATGLLTASICLQGLYLLSCGVSFTGSLAVVCLVIAYVALACFVLCQLGPAYPGLAQPMLLIPVVMFLLPVMGGISSLLPGEFAWLLNGHHLWLVIAGIVAAGFSLRFIVQWISTLHRLLEEHGRGGVPLGVWNSQAWTQWDMATRRASDQRGWQPILASGRRRLEMAIQQGSWQQLTAAADAVSPVMFAMLISGFSLLFGSIFGHGWKNVFTIVQSPAWLGLFFGSAAGMSAVFSQMILFGRRPLFATEILRPVSRDQWRRGWFLLTFRRLSPAFVLAAFAIICQFLAGKITGTTAIPGLIIAWLFFGMMYAADLLLITFRWGLWIFFAALLVAASVLASLAVSLRVRPTDVVAEPGLWLIAALLLILTGGLLSWAWRRWETWELSTIT